MRPGRGEHSQCVCKTSLPLVTYADATNTSVRKPVSPAIPCPVCAGPIGTHVVRPEFTCHHCSWALQANVGSAFQRAIVVGLIAMSLAVGLALLLPLPTDSLFELCVRGGGGMGVIFGTIAYRTALVLTPLRPQRKQTSQSEHSPQSSIS